MAMPLPIKVSDSWKAPQLAQRTTQSTQVPDSDTVPLWPEATVTTTDSRSGSVTSVTCAPP